MAVALAAGGLLAFGGALPASAHAVPSATASSSSDTISADGCTFVVDSQFYFSSYGYNTVKAWFPSATCSVILQAGVTCLNPDQTESLNIWGREDTTTGDSTASVAACNKSWPDFDINGGYRLYYDGEWHYHTELY